MLAAVQVSFTVAMATARSTTPKLKDIEAQITALQARADEIRRTETTEVIAKIKEAIAFYGFSASDLGLSAPRGRKPAATPTPMRGRPARKGTKRVAGAPKYSNGAGKTWTGHGKRPQWFVDALSAGKSADDMLIKGA
jgi:DNA-binding protein H-NS